MTTTPTTTRTAAPVPAPSPVPAEPIWERLSVVIDRTCETPLLVVASLMARRALDVRSASLVEDAEGGFHFEAVVRGRDQRVRSVVCALESRAGVLSAAVTPVSAG
jgi:hypothetical protein